MIGIGFGVITSQGASSARQSRPASSSSTRLAGSSESRAATAAPAEPPPTTMTSYMALLLDVPQDRNGGRYQTADWRDRRPAGRTVPTSASLVVDVKTYSTQQHQTLDHLLVVDPD